MLAERPEALAIGATVRAWMPTVGFAHLAFNLVVLAILGLAIGVSMPFGEFAGMLTGFFLSAPLFLAFPFLFQGLSARLRPAVPRNTKGWDQGSGYYFLLGFAAVWLGIVGSMQALEVWRLQRAEIYAMACAWPSCWPVVFQAVAAPEKLRAATWRQLLLYLGHQQPCAVTASAGLRTLAVGSTGALGGRWASVIGSTNRPRLMKFATNADLIHNLSERLPGSPRHAARRH